MREKPTTREIYADILSFSDGKRVLSVSETARYLHTSRDFVRDKLGGLVDKELGVIVAYNLAARLAASYKE